MADGDIVLRSTDVNGDISFDSDLVISPDGITSIEAFGTATVTPGPVTLIAAGILSQEVFGASTVTPGAVTLTAAGISSLEAFGLATVINSIIIAPSGIASLEAFGAALLTVLNPAFLTRSNALNQKLDIKGSEAKIANKTLVDEPKNYGQPTGNSGSSASITVSSGVVIVTGLTGMTSASVGKYLILSNTSNMNNIGGFLIGTVNSSSSVVITNTSAVTDLNNGSISWTERNPYSLEDDINFIRTDRKNIKGTINFYDNVPTYSRPDATSESVSANLNNIAGKTTDSLAFVFDKIKRNVSVAEDDTIITITDAGNLKHANSTNRTGIPIFDGLDAGDHLATYVKIIDASNGQTLTVQDGEDAGKLIYGRTKKGSSTSPNSIEIELRVVGFDEEFSDSMAYTWENSQPSAINLIYGYRERIDLMDESSFRKIF